MVILIMKKIHFLMDKLKLIQLYAYVLRIISYLKMRLFSKKDLKE